MGIFLASTSLALRVRGGAHSPATFHSTNLLLPKPSKEPPFGFCFLPSFFFLSTNQL